MPSEHPGNSPSPSASQGGEALLSGSLVGGGGLDGTLHIGQLDKALDQLDQSANNFSVEEKNYTLNELDAIQDRAAKRMEDIVKNAINDLQKPKLTFQSRVYLGLSVSAVVSAVIVGAILMTNVNKGTSEDMQKNGYALFAAAVGAVFGLLIPKS